MRRIVLKKKRDAAVKRFHPWVFSGAVFKMDEQLKDGEIVEVYDSENKYLATGHYQDGSICVRIFSFKQQSVDDTFWKDKIQNAFLYRQKLGLTNNSKTNCYRLIHAEGDGLPGLIIDIYGQTAVIQCHSIGMFLNKEDIANALREIYGKQLLTIYNKSTNTLPSQYASNTQNSYLFGKKNQGIVIENGHQFQIDWEKGQKTGFFLDQRDNRQFLTRYSKGKKMLNAFCYSGGFSIYALRAGAIHVDSVDISQNAIELTRQNVALIDQTIGTHQAIEADVLSFLKETEEDYDLIVVDPPAFAKSLKKRHKAVQAYKRLNAMAFKKIKSGGILFTFSCSQVVDKRLFYDTIVAAAIEAGRQVRVMHHLTQPADHPVSLFHPEGSYLKGLVLQVE